MRIVVIQLNYENGIYIKIFVIDLPSDETIILRSKEQIVDAKW